MRRRTQWTTAAALLGFAVTACAGPQAPLDVGTQAAPISLVLGELKAVMETPVGPLPAAQLPNTFTLPPLSPLPAVLPSGPPPFPNPCPDYDVAAPVLGVGNVLPNPPVAPKAYPYRVVGAYLDNYPGRTFTFVGNTSWRVQVGKPDATTGAYDVTYTVTMGKRTTTRVLRTLPHDIQDTSALLLTDPTNPNSVVKQVNDLGVLPSPLPTGLPNLAGYGHAGIYLVSQQTNGHTFTPSVPMALLQLRQLTGAIDPASVAGAAITSVGIDPTSQAVMAFRSTVTNPTYKINACGDPLQTVQVSFTTPAPPVDGAPTNVGGVFDVGLGVFAEKNAGDDPTQPKVNVMLFGQKVAFGLQYGGLVLDEDLLVGPLQGLQLDPKDPPTAPGSPPPSPQPTPQWLSTELAGWALTPAIEYAATHMILKLQHFTINVKPAYPKAS